LSTKTIIQQNKQQQKFIEDSLLNLIDTVQNITVTEIPMWQNNYITSLTSGSDSSSLIEQQKNGILSKLQTISK
jgi:hypothetical protein